MRGPIADWSLVGDSALILAPASTSLGEREHRSRLAVSAA